MMCRSRGTKLMARKKQQSSKQWHCIHNNKFLGSHTWRTGNHSCLAPCWPWRGGTADRAWAGSSHLQIRKNKCSEGCLNCSSETQQKLLLWENLFSGFVPGSVSFASLDHTNSQIPKLQTCKPPLKVNSAKSARWHHRLCGGIGRVCNFVTMMSSRALDSACTCTSWCLHTTWCIVCTFDLVARK